MNIRKMRLEDEEQVIEMMKIFYASPALLHHAEETVLRRDFKDCIEENPYIDGYILESDDVIAGYAMTAHSYSTEYGGECIWIEDLYIKPEYRNQKMGSQFFAYIENKFKNKAVRFRLEVEAENENALKTYEKNGYQKLLYVQMTKEQEL